jgi:predicted metal-binding membrane protein
MTAATAERRRLPVAVPIAIALAWAAAVAAHGTGVAGRFHHDALFADDIPSLVGVGGYALSWTVMVTAMMLPSAVPLLRLFVETSAGQARRGRLLTCFAAGYLAVWLMFGWAALVFDGGVHQSVDAVAWLAARPWLVGAATLGLAGPSSSRPSRTAASPSAGIRPPTCCATTGAGLGPPSGSAGATASTAWAAAGR